MGVAVPTLLFISILPHQEYSLTLSNTLGVRSFPWLNVSAGPGIETTTASFTDVSLHILVNQRTSKICDQPAYHAKTLHERFACHRCFLLDCRQQEVCRR